MTIIRKFKRNWPVLSVRRSANLSITVYDLDQAALKRFNFWLFTFTSYILKPGKIGSTNKKQNGASTPRKVAAPEHTYVFYLFIFCFQIKTRYSHALQKRTLEQAVYH